MIGFSQTNDISGVLTRNIKENQMACWLEQPTSNKEFCDAIDEIMKHEHEDVILLDDTLSSGAPLELDLDSISDLLETPSTAPVTTASAVSPISPSSTTDYSQSTNIYDMTSPPHRSYSVNSNSQSNSTTSAYSALGISPKFTTLSINQHHHPFSPSSQDSNSSSTLLQSFVQSPITINSKSSLHPPPYIQEQQNTSILGTSYPFELQINSGLSDVKRFRSSSMNEGATQQHQTKLDPHLFDPYRLKLPPYTHPPYYQNRTSSTNIPTTPTTTTTTTSSTSSLSNDVSSNTAWPFAGYTRPASNSFSEVLNQQQQLRIGNSLSASYGGSPSFYSIHPQRNHTGFSPDTGFQPQQTTNCTLYSLNQPRGGAASPPPPPSVLARKRSSLVGFPVQEIKDDPSSPNCTIEQQSEPDLWSDIEQNSSDHMQDNDIDDDDITSDDEDDDDDDDATTVSSTYNKDSDPTKSSQSHSNSSSLFWQYNVQAKGPKTKRILYLKERDPHLFREFSDPVYQIKLTQTKGQTFTKLRKGDGNDVTPNPVKLYQLGKQIRDLTACVGKTNSSTTSVYHGIYHVEQQTNNNDTAEVKKEKNKIASRACRLRKKAQHEANKLKLHGLNEEHKTLIDLIIAIKLLILKRYHNGQLASPSSSPNQSLEAAVDQLVANKYNKPVAGNTDGFVQGIINDMEHLYAAKQQRSNSLNT
ncbi:unnamed protein product [Rotaria sp. Silwood2]|nr:unnamed protein product [Rotaria sp. Silwood2]CAF4272633.1 unnamed protein product [Rotaria sp. Silwood2]